MSYIGFKPLLASTAKPDDLNFPLYASIKIDGFRCCISAAGTPMTRSLKPIANFYVAGKLEEMNIPYMDGELVTYTGDKLDDFNTIQSKLTTRQGMPDFKFMVFDYFRWPKSPFVDRYDELCIKVKQRQDPRLIVVEQILMVKIEECEDYYNTALVDNWEGIMLRHPDGIYKYGRSTVNEAILLKLKPLDDDEALIIGVQERMHNANEATTSNLGYKERSSHKDNMVPTNSLGAFKCQWKGVEFDLGTGFSERQRQEYWQQNLIGRVVTFKYQGVGSGGRPRFPRFKGFRDKADL